METGIDSIIRKTKFENKDVILKCAEFLDGVVGFVEAEEKAFKVN
jgi:hypothetical protein